MKAPAHCLPVALFLLLALVPCAPATSSARAAADDEEIDLFDWELRLMFWGVSAGRESVAGQEERIEDFFTRRARIVLKARPADDLSLRFQFGHDNAGSKISEEDNGLRIKDAFLNYRVNNGFQILAGQFKIPFLRHNLESGFKQLLVDRAKLPALRPAKEGARDIGGMAWGNRGGFQYRTAVFDGSDQEQKNDRSSLRGTLRVSYNWFTHEHGLDYTATSVGRRRILQLGAQVDAQNDRLDPKDDAGFDTLPRDYRAWAAEVFYDEPFGGGWALTFEGAWLDRRDDYADPALDERRIEGFYAQAGALLPGKVGPGRLQIVARYEDFDTERGAALSKRTNRSAGITYFGRDHKFKIQLEYTDRREEPDEIDNDQVRLSVSAIL
ncbi:MAG: porin [Acidobacteriota bacterium]